MWTDGSRNSHTNFAADSGLEGDHCCIKVKEPGWRIKRMSTVRLVEQAGEVVPVLPSCTASASSASLGNYLQIQELWSLR